VPPQLAIADGALAFWKAAGEVWPKTREQRCWVHYADLRIMPTKGWTLAPEAAIAARGVGIIKAPQGKRAACRAAGSDRARCRPGSFSPGHVP
jgi:hypothetical protein